MDVHVCSINSIGGTRLEGSVSIVALIIVDQCDRNLAENAGKAKKKTCKTKVTGINLWYNTGTKRNEFHYQEEYCKTPN